MTIPGSLSDAEAAGLETCGASDAARAVKLGDAGTPGEAPQATVRPGLGPLEGPNKE